jgi:hypothetical protein
LNAVYMPSVRFPVWWARAHKRFREKKGFPPENGTLQARLEAFFEQYGPTNAVRMRRDGDKKFKVCLFSYQSWCMHIHYYSAVRFCGIHLPRHGPRLCVRRPCAHFRGLSAPGHVQGGLLRHENPRKRSLRQSRRHA